MLVLVRCFAFILLLMPLAMGCSEEGTEEETEDEDDSGAVQTTTTVDAGTGGVGSATNNGTSPGYSGAITGYFIGHSAMNDVVADHVATHASGAGTAQLTVTESTTEGLSLEDKAGVPGIAAVLGGGTHTYDFVVITEVWDYQNYDAEDQGAATNAAPSGCPDSSYTPPSDWTNPPSDWSPTPYYVQRYRDAFVCGNSATRVFYYQTWSLGYNEVENGATRASDSSFVRPGLDQELVWYPDLALADRIEYEGLKWQKFVAAANRPDIIFIPAAYALARLMRAIEAGTAPGFEALAATGGLHNGRLAWADYLFYEDQYHLSSVGHYFMALVIYASVFDADPTGIPVGSGLYPGSEYFADGQYPLRGVSDAEYETLLAEAGASGVYDLRGHNNLDYLPDSLRDYLQTLARTTVVEERQALSLSP